MALPTVTDLKSYLRIESAAENALLAQLLARAQAMLEAWLDVPITAETQTAVDEASAVDMPVPSLVFPRRPINAATVTITDADADTVDATTYRVNSLTGIITSTANPFDNGPYTITASCGLSLRADYARIEPLVSGMIIDLAADLYQRRTPGASSESAAGTSISWDVSRETIARVQKSIRALRLGVAQ